ncbi:hypothetical protein K7432_012838 [Basidiobolus ranarum]|uniref:Uncharacterized protein n=1 Tax=Basidiobolus ranarum TaxID=34480 RepID=A0ABR2WK62_9FUNG
MISPVVISILLFFNIYHVGAQLSQTVSQSNSQMSAYTSAIINTDHKLISTLPNGCQGSYYRCDPHNTNFFFYCHDTTLYTYSCGTKYNKPYQCFSDPNSAVGINCQQEWIGNSMTTGMMHKVLTKTKEKIETKIASSKIPCNSATFTSKCMGRDLKTICYNGYVIYYNCLQETGNYCYEWPSQNEAFCQPPPILPSGGGGIQTITTCTQSDNTCWGNLLVFCINGQFSSRPCEEGTICNNGKCVSLATIKAATSTTKEIVTVEKTVVHQTTTFFNECDSEYKCVLPLILPSFKKCVMGKWETQTCLPNSYCVTFGQMINGKVLLGAECVNAITPVAISSVPTKSKNTETVGAKCDHSKCSADNKLLVVCAGGVISSINPCTDAVPGWVCVRYKGVPMCLPPQMLPSTPQIRSKTQLPDVTSQHSAETSKHSAETSKHSTETSKHSKVTSHHKPTESPSISIGSHCTKSYCSKDLQKIHACYENRVLRILYCRVDQYCDDKYDPPICMQRKQQISQSIAPETGKLHSSSVTQTNMNRSELTKQTRTPSSSGFPNGKSEHTDSSVQSSNKSHSESQRVTPTEEPHTSKYRSEQESTKSEHAESSFHPSSKSHSQSHQVNSTEKQHSSTNSVLTPSESPKVITIGSQCTKSFCSENLQNIYVCYEKKVLRIEECYAGQYCDDTFNPPICMQGTPPISSAKSINRHATTKEKPQPSGSQTEYESKRSHDAESSARPSSKHKSESHAAKQTEKPHSSEPQSEHESKSGQHVKISAYPSIKHNSKSDDVRPTKRPLSSKFRIDHESKKSKHAETSVHSLSKSHVENHTAKTSEKPHSSEYKSQHVWKSSQLSESSAHPFSKHSSESHTAKPTEKPHISESHSEHKSKSSEHNESSVHTSSNQNSESLGAKSTEKPHSSESQSERESKKSKHAESSVQTSSKQNSGGHEAKPTKRPQSNESQSERESKKSEHAQSSVHPSSKPNSESHEAKPTEKPHSTKSQIDRKSKQSKHAESAMHTSNKHNSESQVPEPTQKPHSSESHSERESKKSEHAESSVSTSSKYNSESHQAKPTEKPHSSESPSEHKSKKRKHAESSANISSKHNSESQGPKPTEKPHSSESQSERESKKSKHAASSP